MSRGRSLWSLARWLGPWEPPEAKPRGVVRETVRIEPVAPGDRPYPAWVYRPARSEVRGAYLIAPGLQFDGPSDARFDRLSTVLAASGYVVMAPFLPDFVRLRMTIESAADLRRAFHALESLAARPIGARPGLLTISFGSLPALRMAAHPDVRDRIGGVVVFGGCADFPATVRFLLTGEEEGQPPRPRDMRNQPAAFISLWEGLAGAPPDREVLHDAWLRVARATWGRPERRAGEGYAAVVETIASRLPEDLRGYFRKGCGTDPTGEALAFDALARGTLREVDVRRWLPQLRAPIRIVHGRQDEVIPWTQARVLHESLPPHHDRRLLITGMMSHSAAHRTGAGSLAALPATAREVGTLVAVLAAVESMGRG